MKKIKYIIALFLVTTCLSAFTLAGNGPKINWGLSPTTNETTPAAPERAQTMLDEYNGLYVGNTDKKEVYFTFDLGYESGYTAQVLDILKENNIKCIFFLCGHYLTETELVNRMLTEGHTIGNHTDKHKELPTLSNDGIKTDIATFQNDYKTKYPDQKAPVFFRPPKGSFDERTLQIAKDEGLRTMLWSIAIVDWGKKAINAKSCADKITSRIHPGAIILFHITNSGTPEMLKLLIPQLKEKGYTIGHPGSL